MAYKKETKSKDDSCFSFVNQRVKESESHTQAWSSNQEKWHKMRMRIKKSKTFPFVGCSNIRMPTAEIKLRKVKAAIVNTIFGIRPVVQAIPTPSGNWQTSKKIEKFIDHLVMDIMKLQPKATICIDQEIEKGFYLMKPHWRTEVITRSEEVNGDELDEQQVAILFNEQIPQEAKIQLAFEMYDIDQSKLVYEDNYNSVSKAIDELISGKKTVKLSLKDVIYDYPDVALVSPERCYVPTDSGWNPQECDFIVHEYFLPYNVIKEKAINDGWDKKAINEISKYKGYKEEDKKLTDIQKDLREGIETLNDKGEKVKIWEYYGYYDIDGDGEDEKCVITLAPCFGKTLNKRLLPFDNYMYPFIKFFYELTDDRWFSHRGLIEISEDIIKEIDVQHNQKIDQQTIRNAPMFVYRAGMVNPNAVQFMPNQGIPVNGMNPLRDSIDVLNNNNPNVEYSYEREQMLLESKLEELTGQIDSTLQSMINRREPRTLGEVELQYQNMQNVFSLDINLMVGQFSELFSFIWDLWCQYGNDDYEFAYFGKEGWEKIRLTREEIQGKYKIVVRGNDQNTNPQMKIQKAQQILMGTTNPVYIQTGVVTPTQMVEGLKRFYQELDIPNYELLVNQNPQPQMPQQPSPIDRISPKFADLTDAEKAQVLASGGIRADGQGRNQNRAIEIAEKIGK